MIFGFSTAEENEILCRKKAEFVQRAGLKADAEPENHKRKLVFAQKCQNGQIMLLDESTPNRESLFQSVLTDRKK